MLGQYKKIAMGKWTGRYTRTRAQFIDQGILIQGQSNDLYSWWKLPKNLRIEIPLNLNFTPSIIFMTFDQLSPGTGFKMERIKYQINTRDHYCYNDVDIKNKKKVTTVASTSSYLEAFVEEVSKEKVILNMYVQKNLFNQGAGTNVYTQNCQWVAIE